LIPKLIQQWKVWIPKLNSHKDLEEVEKDLCSTSTYIKSQPEHLVSLSQCLENILNFLTNFLVIVKKNFREGEYGYRNLAWEKACGIIFSKHHAELQSL